MANDGKSMFSLSSDGVSFEFFNLLWSKDELNFGPSLNFPDTIIFKSGTPSNWYARTPPPRHGCPRAPQPPKP